MAEQKMLANANELRALLANADNRPVPHFLNMRTRLPTEGKFDVPLAATDRLWLVLKTYASGGENELHAHPNEDHVFVVMQGQAEFFGPKNERRVVGKHECVLLPRGTIYSFKAFGDEALVLLRVGAVVDPADDPIYRVDLNGEKMDGFSAENRHVQPVLGDRYFE